MVPGTLPTLRIVDTVLTTPNRLDTIKQSVELRITVRDQIYDFTKYNLLKYVTLHTLTDDRPLYFPYIHVFLNS